MSPLELAIKQAASRYWWVMALAMVACGEAPCPEPPSLSCSIQQTDGQWYRTEVIHGPQVNVVKLVKCDCGGAQ